MPGRWKTVRVFISSTFRNMHADLCFDLSHQVIPFPGVPEYQYAVKVGDLQRVRIPPGQSVTRPEATRAAKEVTNSLNYSGETGHLG